MTNQITSFTWDAYDRITSIRNPKGEVTKFVYETSRVLDSPSSIIDPMGKTTQLAYDARGRLILTTDAKGAVTTYGYDLAGELISVTDANGNVTSYAYDGNGRKISETRASVMGTNSGNQAVNSTKNYFYDAGGRLIKEEKVSASGGDSRIIEYQYDEFDRLSKKILKKGSEIQDESVYSYESQLDATLLKTAANGVANLGFSHEALPPFAGTGFSQSAAEAGNPLGLLEKGFTTVPGITGEVAKIQDELGNVLFMKAYDPAGRLIGVKAGNFKTGISYDGFGRRMHLAHSDGSTQTIQYDFLNRIKALSWRTKTGPIEEHLNYDPSGNVFELSRENARYDLQYDAVNQLTAVKSMAPGGEEPYTRSWGYDLLGNRLRDSHANTLSEFVSNFLVRNGESSFTADPDGLGQVAQEITGDKAKNYTYRADGKISGFQSGDLSVSYFYDALNRLVARIINENGVQKIESFVHLDKQDRVLLGKAKDGSITIYIDGLGAAERLGEVKNGVGKGYITDHLGSVLNSPFAGLSKTVGLFGEIFTKPKLADDAGPMHYVFAGYSYDPYSGTYMNGPRNMNPEVGRWNSQEPTGADGPNYYWYAKNNSLINVDPTGRASGNYTDNMGSLPQSGTGAAAGTSGLEQSARGLGRLGGAAFGVCAAGAASPDIAAFCLSNPLQCQEIGLAVAAGIGQGTSGADLPPDPTQPWEPAVIEKILATLSGN